MSTNLVNSVFDSSRLFNTIMLKRYIYIMSFYKNNMFINLSKFKVCLFHLMKTNLFHF